MMLGNNYNIFVIYKKKKHFIKTTPNENKKALHSSFSLAEDRLDNRLFFQHGILL